MMTCRRAALVLMGICGAAMAMSPALAAEAALEEVIVTAQKKEQDLQQTPISLEAFSADTLEQRGITNVADLANQVPDLHIMPFGSASTTLNIFIRGVGAVDSQVTEDPPVGIYLNGVYIARPVGLSTDQADLERIEVLRGPQGTLYGRNTTGGAINIITARPDSQLGGSELVSLGNYGAVRSQSMVNLPVSDTLYVRASLDWSTRDGWLRNTGVGADFSAYDQLSGRVDLRWKPLEAVTVDYSYDQAKDVYSSDYYHLTEPTAAFDFLPAQPHRLGATTLAAPFQDSNDLVSGHTLTIAVQTPAGEVKSITAYRDLHSYAYQDFSGNETVTIYRNDPIIVRQHQISQEFQLVGSTPGKLFDYIGGLYYFDENAASFDTDRIDLYDVTEINNVEARNKTYAAYGQLTFRPSADSRWAYTVGGRYTKDDRYANNLLDVPGSTGSTDYSNFSPSATVEFQPTNAVNLYAKAVEGYKAGGFNWREGNFENPFGPEKIITYELGWKTEWLQHRLRWNNAIFYSDYKDIQLDIIVPGQPNPTLTETKNAGKARVAGDETELNFALTEGFRVGLSYAYLYNDIVEVAGDNASLWHLAAAPKNSVNANLDWDLLKFTFGTLNFKADYSWRGESFTTSRDVIGDGATVPSYGLADASLSLIGENWLGHGSKCRVSAWVRNIGDTQYLLDPFGSFSGLHAIKLSNYGTPRTFGIDFKVAF
jgi:iron complex outermembrane recepter protein